MTLVLSEARQATPALGTLVSNLAAATDTLNRVEGQLENCEAAQQRVAAAIPTLVGFVGELEELEAGPNTPRPDPHSWTLDRSWHNTAFAVASARPRVLLTLAANALSALIGLYTHALDEVMPAELEAVFSRHRDAIGELRHGFTDLRGWSLLQSVE